MFIHFIPNLVNPLPEIHLMHYRCLDIDPAQLPRTSMSQVPPVESGDEPNYTDDNSYRRLFGLVLEFCSVVQEKPTRQEAFDHVDLMAKYGFDHPKVLKRIVKRQIFEQMMLSNVLHCYDFYYPKWHVIKKLIKYKLWLG